MLTEHFIYLDKMLLATDDDNRQLFSKYLSLEDFEEDIYRPKWLISEYKSNKDTGYLVNICIKKRLQIMH